MNKKLVSLSLAGLLIASTILFFPARTEAAMPANYCYTDYQDCRENAFALDVSWVKMTLILTVCDIALGKCLLDL